MFIIEFGGGLGNQMYEYAFYKKICKIYNRNRVVIQWDPISASFHYGYELEKAFNIQLPFASPDQSAKYSNFYPRNGKKYQLCSRIFNIRSRIFGNKASFIKQRDFTEYYPEIFELSPLRSYYLLGIWANEKYFRDIREELIQDFVFSIPQESDNNALIQEMERVNSVSVHLRNFWAPVDVVLESNFYRQAIDIMKSKVENPKFYVFSDDLNKAKNLFDGMIEYRLIDHNRGENSYLDMMLMSKCKHNIIGNSTFSFWGAYLNQNPEKVVIGSKTGSDGICNSFSCEGWMKI